MNDPARHAVWLYDQQIGWLFHHDNYTWFEFRDDYLAAPDRPVLGLRFEERPHSRFAANLRLPQWFSNLLPEGILRDWIAAERDVSPEREMELIAQVGHDLPGAVRVLPDGHYPVPDVASVIESVPHVSNSLSYTPQPWKFSLAGVGLKFSMLRNGKQFSCTATGEGGDWILKLPDARFQDVPRNEFTMMRFARSVGIDVPEVAIVHRDDIDGLPSGIWPNREVWAYAVRRFDRSGDRGPIHIEDFAQVRGIYPVQKYEGNFETVAALAYRGHDLRALHEFVRRLVFFVLIGNGDAHLKNWSLIYTNKQVPTLSPAYDIVSTELYGIGDGPEDLGLKFAGNRRFDAVRINQFDKLARRLDVKSDLAAIALEVLDLAQVEWPVFAEELSDLQNIRDSVHESIFRRSSRLMRTR
ncbi:type II toxin-antitoxin system HipA family toxin [Nocardia sp. NPDC058058]|uniref:type II toxin-antitoxin system HipA family toxin n=1 Tax=Nocardia sp. NPDC058058 TaxID=3346317 RepID=UPI0036DC7541